MQRVIVTNIWLQFSYIEKEKCKVVVVMGQRPLKKTEALSKVKKIHCLCCNKEDESDNYYDSDSLQYRTYGKIPYCTTCIEKMYLEYLTKFKVLNKGDKPAIKQTFSHRKTVHRGFVIEALCFQAKGFFVFFYPYCDSVNKMSAKKYSGTGDEIIDMDYAPCKRCNP